MGTRLKIRTIISRFHSYVSYFSQPINHVTMATGLSHSQKNAIRASWSRFRDNAVPDYLSIFTVCSVKHYTYSCAAVFRMFVYNLFWFSYSLFKQFTETLNAFKSLFYNVGFAELKDHPKMQAQSIFFCYMLSSFIDHLDDVNIFRRW